MNRAASRENGKNIGKWTTTTMNSQGTILQEKINSNDGARQGQDDTKSIPRQDDPKSILDWETLAATLVVNKNDCQVNGGLVDGFKIKEREKMTNLDIEIKHDLEISTTSESQHFHIDLHTIEFQWH